MTIPKEAWPVVEEIRKRVPRPKELPTPGITPKNSADTCFGWECDGEGHKCPLGLLPYAIDERPSGASDFDFDSDYPFDIEQARTFWEWWDAQIDAKNAVAEVWENPMSE